MAKKRKNGLSIAIVALNIVIVGIIILLIALIYLHMRDDSGSNRTGSVTTTTSSGVSETTSAVSDISTSASSASVDTNTAETAQSEETTAESPAETTFSVDNLVLPQYNKDFFSNDLFIGDSISTGLYLYSYLNNENVFAEVGLNPESALTKEVDGVTCVGKATAMQPTRIYIMLGTNGLAFLGTEYMATKMTELVSELEMACPTAKIFVISLPPVTQEHDAEGNETMAKINDYNSRLEALCTQGGYTYVDICSKMLDENGYFSSSYAESDGLHFLGSAYALLLGTIQTQIGE